MKNITLSASEKLIEAARNKALKGNSTLNAEFRNWLEYYVDSKTNNKRRINNYRRVMSDFSSISIPKLNKKSG